MALDVTVDRDVVRAVAASVASLHDHVAVVIPADVSLHGGSVLEALPKDDRSLWWQPEKALLMAGAGTAVSVEATASADADETTRFGSIPLGVLSVGIADPYEVGIVPRLVGGFSFFADDVWDGFGRGDLRLPKLAYIREGARAAWVVTSPAGRVADAVDAVTRVEAALGSGPSTSASEAPAPLDLVEPHPAESRRLIADTIAAIRDGQLQKVVIARTATARVRLDPSRLVGVLAERYPECATFAFERAGEWFIGATPELLVSKQGRSVTSGALAATAPRHADPVLDRIELESLQTTKQLEEHRLVVDAIVESLNGLGVVTSTHEQRVLELRNVRHLATAIEGSAPDGVDILDLVGSLHPTPAVGGVPGSGALAWIRRHEGFTRGWYAGPIGVVDLAGNGEFRVALRSARLRDDAMHLYAGAGIVAGSDPDAEMAEIDLKLGVMAGAAAAAAG